MFIYSTAKHIPIQYSVTKFCGTAANWTNSANVYADDGTNATVSISNNTQASAYLHTTNYGFAIPSTATIDGIVMEMNAYCLEASGVIQDMTVKLTKSGSLFGNDMRKYPTTWPTTTSNIYTYGASNDKWGTTFTYSDINDSTFGVDIRVTSSLSPPGTARTAAIDYVRITIYYTW